MTPVEVGAFNVTETSLLNGYAAATWEQTQAVLASLAGDRLDEVIDNRYTPPVTVGVRLVSVLVETAQHIGQAGYLRGLRERSLGINSGWAGTA
jgi:energy-coupling factor transporter transmembrane protein EcfT